MTYDRIFLYDSLLKPAGHDTALDADLNPGGTLQQFTLSQKLDAYFGRVVSLTDPEFRVRGRYQYNRDGYLTNVQAHLRNTDNTIRTATVKTVTALTARGQIANVLLGNGLTDSRTYYPATGQVRTMQVGDVFQGAGAVVDLEYGYDRYLNLSSQINNKIGREEIYSYDRLHRLTSRSGPQEISTITPIDPSSPNSAGTEGGTTAPIGPDPKPVIAGGVNYSYDPLGNLTAKTDYGSPYTYRQLFTAGQVAGCINDSRGFRTTAPGPHAATEVGVTTQSFNDGGLGGGTVGATTPRKLAYDKNGNLLCFGDGALNLWYDPYNLPEKIQRFNQMQEFRYGPDLQRYLQVAGGVTTVYLERSYEKEISTNKVRFQISEDVLIRMEEGQNPVVDYQHRDRLGSIVAVTNEFKAIEGGTERGFGPFGKPRDANWNDQNILPGANITPRGFTDHEHLNGSRLIHMNGRAYDYNLGRFLSVDPVIQFPANSQSLNPYSYIMNNPLSGTDPTGYSLVGLPAGSGSICGKNASCFMGGLPLMFESKENGNDKTQTHLKIGMKAAKEILDKIGDIKERLEMAPATAEGRAMVFAEINRLLAGTENAIFTTFFQAAVEVNGQLALGSIDPGAPGDFLGANELMGATEGFLQGLGRFLFVFNVDLGKTLLSGMEIKGLEGLMGQALDEAIVGLEQTLVQSFLDNFETDPLLMGIVEQNLGTTAVFNTQNMVKGEAPALVRMSTPFPTREQVVDDVNSAFNGPVTRAKILFAAARNKTNKAFRNEFPNDGTFDFGTFENRARLGIGIIDLLRDQDK